jgi:hypothetical protein
MEVTLGDDFANRQDKIVMTNLRSFLLTDYAEIGRVADTTRRGTTMKDKKDGGAIPFDPAFSEEVRTVMTFARIEDIADALVERCRRRKQFVVDAERLSRTETDEAIFDDIVHGAGHAGVEVKRCSEALAALVPGSPQAKKAHDMNLESYQSYLRLCQEKRRRA